MTIEPNSQYRELRSSGNTINCHTILNQILWSCHHSLHECCRTFEDIDAQLAEEVARALEKGDIEAKTHRFTYDANLKELKVVLMPNRIHDSHQTWMALEVFTEMTVAGYLTRNEALELNASAGTTFKAFGAPYTGSRKEPDYCLYPDSLNLPTVVIESGWSESRPALERDMNLWLEGGQGMVQLVMIIKWTKDSNQRVSGDIRVFDLDPAGNIQKLQTEQIFPCPANGASQKIDITRSQLYGTAPLPVGRNGTDTWQFSLDNLRNVASRGIQQEGYTPA